MEEKKPRKPWLSSSALSTYEGCAEQYRRRYIENERIPPGIAMIKGSSVDDSVTKNLQSVIDSGKMLPKEEAKTVAEESMKNRIKNEQVLFSEEEIATGIKTVKGNAIDSVVGLSELHYDELAPTIKPLQVQAKWVLELENFPFDVLGYIDILETVRTVRDTKVSGKSPNKNAADVSEQLTLYALGVYADKKFIPTVFLDYVIDTKTRKTLVLKSTRTKNDFQSIMNRLEMMAHGLEKEVFMPCDAGHWKCNPKWCGYFSSCRYSRR